MKVQVAGIDVDPVVAAPLDPGFVPAALFNRKYREVASARGGVPVKLALERGDGSTSTYCTSVVRPECGYWPATQFYVERIIKFLLWQRGGWRVYVGGPASIGEHIRTAYSPTGARKFDAEFMGGVYERPFEVVVTQSEDVSEARETTIPLGRHLDGCRVGFDLGASDRKCSAVIDGEVVFSEEVVWDPRHASDPQYHYDGVMDSIRRAARHLPRLDAVGGSAAGVYINNRVRVASLYRGVPPRAFEERIAPLFLRVRDELGVPLEVVNDGEVTALAGSMSLGSNPVLGIALGSSQAGGYVTAQGNITGWLNELAFVPVDYRADAPVDEWSGDSGCGVQYFSQVAAHRIASGAGMAFEPGLGLPERLQVLQQKMQAGDPLAARVYETLGCYLGYGVAHYAEFYDLKHILILGRVTTGPGGEILLHKAEEVLRADFPPIAERVSIRLPDEASRRVGQSIAAASLPAIPSCGTKPGRIPQPREEEGCATLEEANETEPAESGNLGPGWSLGKPCPGAHHSYEHRRAPGRRRDYGPGGHPRGFRQSGKVVHRCDRHQRRRQSAR
jgi:predicted NBD/HSP70 family sugar kinase